MRAIRWYIALAVTLLLVWVSWRSLASEYIIPIGSASALECSSGDCSLWVDDVGRHPAVTWLREKSGSYGGRLVVKDVRRYGHDGKVIYGTAGTGGAETWFLVSPPPSQDAQIAVYPDETSCRRALRQTGAAPPVLRRPGIAQADFRTFDTRTSMVCGLLIVLTLVWAARVV